MFKEEEKISPTISPGISPYFRSDIAENSPQPEKEVLKQSSYHLIEEKYLEKVKLYCTDAIAMTTEIISTNDSTQDSYRRNDQRRLMLTLNKCR